MKTHIRRQQHKNFKHQDIKQKEPPQKYRPDLKTWRYYIGLDGKIIGGSGDKALFSQ